jgi:hypothetical protein
MLSPVDPKKINFLSSIYTSQTPVYASFHGLMPNQQLAMQKPDMDVSTPKLITLE